jgi:branched-chain amino acid transport system permease protein
MKAAIAIVLALLLAAPAVLSDFHIYLLSQSLLWGVFALSMGLLLGYLGEINLGQAAFVAISAYLSTLLRSQLGLSFWLAAPVTLVVLMLIAAAVGFITLRLRGPYFVLVMLGFGEVVRLIIANWQDVTNGMLGLRNIPPPESLPFLDFGTRFGFYYLLLATVVVSAAGLRVLVRSPLGRILVAIREDEILAEFSGAAIMRSKVIALTISALVAGLGGLLIGPFLTVLSPGQFTVFASVDMIVMVVVGGVGTLAGPLIGAVFLTYIPETFSFLAELRPILMGGLLIVVTMFIPGGLLGLVQMVSRRLRGGRQGTLPTQEASSAS